jgi:hypothetical protein
MPPLTVNIQSLASSFRLVLFSCLCILSVSYLCVLSFALPLHPDSWVCEQVRSPFLPHHLLPIWCISHSKLDPLSRCLPTCSWLSSVQQQLNSCPQNLPWGYRRHCRPAVRSLDLPSCFLPALTTYSPSRSLVHCGLFSNSCIFPACHTFLRHPSSSDHDRRLPPDWSRFFVHSRLIPILLTAGEGPLSPVECSVPY